MKKRFECIIGILGLGMRRIVFWSWELRRVLALGMMRA